MFALVKVVIESLASVGLLQNSAGHTQIIGHLFGAS